ncbi:MAG: hypothetical protein AAGA11_03805 [Pseudomonadota bacterium]
MEIFRHRSQREAEAKLDQDIEEVNRLLEDPAHQLSMMPERVVEQARRNGRVDTVPGASGSFGTVPTNPIPVNGTVGAMAWLSRLQTRQGESLVFHRVGLLHGLEVYEALSLTRANWFLFFLDPVHLGASRQAPEGFRLMAEGRLFHGVGRLMPRFPGDLERIVASYDEVFRLATVAPNKVLNQLASREPERPVAQRLKLEWLAHQIELSGTVQPRSDALGTAAVTGGEPA